jgi:hypothetical protein
VSFDLAAQPFPVDADGAATIHVELDVVPDEPDGVVLECDEENNSLDIPIDCGLI